MLSDKHLRTQNRRSLDDTTETTTSPEIYHHKSLEHNEQIRLLELGPGEDAEPLSCVLHITSLALAPSYEAISYNWGDTAIQEQLYCDGRHLVVTRNLGDALRRLRCQSASRLLWADAICIDQSNIIERNAQVSMMRSIYGRATSVLIWLGLGTKETAFGMDFIHRLASLHCELNAVTTTAETSDEDLDKLITKAVNIDKYRQVFATTGKSHGVPIQRLFHRPWFRRIWVIQEVTRGSPATVLCGQNVMRWKLFALGAHVLSHCVINNELWPSGQIDIDTRVGIIHTCTTLSRVAWLEKLSFVGLLQYAANFEAGEPKDRIYALLGCSRNSTITSFPVDYGLSLFEIFVRIAPFLYMERHSLEPLNFVHHEHQILSHGPSWVPNVNMFAHSVIGAESFCQDRGWQRYGAVGAKFTINGKELSFTGRLIASVSEISDPASTRLPEYELRQWDPSILDQVIRNFVLQQPTVKQPAAFRAFVEACCLAQGSATEMQDLDTDEDRDDHGRLLLALIYYYSKTGTPPIAPSYLGSAGSSVPCQQDRLYSVETEVTDLTRSVYKVYNINEQYSPTTILPNEDATRLRQVFEYFEVNSIFDEGALYRFQRHISGACFRRRFFKLVGDGADIGIGPEATMIGDVVMQPLGAYTPFILRPVNGQYLCVGECFVSEEMPGRAKAAVRGVSVDASVFEVR